MLPLRIPSMLHWGYWEPSSLHLWNIYTVVFYIWYTVYYEMEYFHMRRNILFVQHHCNKPPLISIYRHADRFDTPCVYACISYQLWNYEWWLAWLWTIEHTAAIIIILDYSKFITKKTCIMLVVLHGTIHINNLFSNRHHDVECTKLIFSLVCCVFLCTCSRLLPLRTANMLHWVNRVLASPHF